ncbi:MAG: UdgX family uracil-DNA binding protein, partial [Actinobacteria bacterium]|nr:UdgX family uracil-DNA binding protein [Actinomycetota bacterium]
MPPGASLDELRAAAAGCRGCHLYENATQTVFGDGGDRADVVLVGEQPGDQEDRRGEPFIGPAGKLLDKALADAGIERTRAYVTNVVKHFKWKPVGKRRIHQKPNAEEIGACRPWLDAELDRLKPRIVVCLGATAAQALLGRGFKVTQQRGQVVEWDRDPLALATVHPSSILRARDEDA